MAYVSAYGNYGAERALFFDYSDLTPKQWETLGMLTDSDKMPYVEAVLNGELTDRWED